MSEGARTVWCMTKQMHQALVPDPTVEPMPADEPMSADELCPRCGSEAVRVADTVTLSGGDALFDCRECGFEWGELLRDLMA
jgi:predicted RNA-binding Zn-ribbon protein involved in translation (DUF1610 family)